MVLRYKPTDEMSIYASYSKGYKAAFLDLGGGVTNRTVKPEKIDAYEVGLKFDNRTVALEVAGFYYDYKDLQVSLYQSGQALIVNAASAKIYGLDAQVRFNVSDAFSINAGRQHHPCALQGFPQRADLHALFHDLHGGQSGNRQVPRSQCCLRGVQYGQHQLQSEYCGQAYPITATQL